MTVFVVTPAGVVEMITPRRKANPRLIQFTGAPYASLSSGPEQERIARELHLARNEPAGSMAFGSRAQRYLVCLAEGCGMEVAALRPFHFVNLYP